MGNYGQGGGPTNPLMSGLNVRAQGGVTSGQNPPRRPGTVGGGPPPPPGTPQVVQPPPVRPPVVNPPPPMQPPPGTRPPVGGGGVIQPPPGQGPGTGTGNPGGIRSFGAGLPGFDPNRPTYAHPPPDAPQSLKDQWVKMNQGGGQGGGGFQMDPAEIERLRLLKAKNPGGYPPGQEPGGGKGGRGGGGGGPQLPPGVHPVMDQSGSTYYMGPNGPWTPPPGSTNPDGSWKTAGGGGWGGGKGGGPTGPQKPPIHEQIYRPENDPVVQQRQKLEQLTGGRPLPNSMPGKG